MSPSTERTVGSQVLRALVSVLEGMGTPRAALMQALELGPNELSLSAPRLDLRRLSEICERVLRSVADPALGLHWGERLDERSFGPISHMLANTRSLRSGFALLQHFEPLLCDGRAFELEERTSTFVVRLVQTPFREHELARFAAEVALSGMLTTVRWFFAGTKPVVANFGYPAPIHRAEYKRIFGRVRFDQRLTELVFDRSLLDRPSLHVDHELQAAFQLVAERRLARLTRGAPFAVQLREYLLAHGRERPTMVDAARMMMLSDRTLRRHLAREGTSYREVEYGALATVAKQLLYEQGLTVQRAAHEMGFSDAATFHRAFKAWTGLTPREFREHARG